MSPETEPTPWELMRVMREVRDDVRAMRRDMVSSEVFKEYREASDRRFLEVERDHREWTIESREEHVRLDAKVDAVNVAWRASMDEERAQREALGRAQRESRTRNWLAIGLAVFSLVGSLAVGLVMRAVGG